MIKIPRGVRAVRGLNRRLSTQVGVMIGGALPGAGVVRKAFMAGFVLVMVLFSISQWVNDAKADSLGGWTTKTSMPTARFGLGAATVNGIIYAMGGDVNYYGCGPTSANEAYDPATNTWTAKAPLITPHMNGFGVAVLNNNIYVIGGSPQCTNPTRAVEAYDPATNTWTAKAPLPASPGGYGLVDAAVGVINGILYVAGGSTEAGITNTLYAYDPETNTWATKTPMPIGRYVGVGAVVNGILYVVGGNVSGGTAATSTFAYDPITDTWSTKAPMNISRGWLTAAVVNNRIYAIGGGTAATNWGTATEEYDPLTDTWTVLADMPTGRQAFGAAEVNGTIHAIGGLNASLGAGLATVEAYTPVPPTSDVLVAGGFANNTSSPPTAEVFHESTGTWSATTNTIAYGTIPTNGICGANMTLLRSGKALIAGGSCGGDDHTVTNAASLYDPATNLWSMGDSMAYGRQNFALVTMGNGDALAIGGCAGGCSGPNVLGQYAGAVGGSAEQYSATGDSWTTKHTLNTARSGLGLQNWKAVTLKDGKVLVCGGNNAFSTTYTSCEIYDPKSDTWATTAGAYPEVGGPTGVVLLNSGKVLAVLNSSLGAVLFDPATTTWSATGAPASLQMSANLTLLSDGRVLMTGGFSYNAGIGTTLAGAQIYNPTTESWTTTGSMGIGRGYHFAVLLMDGKVLAGGGLTGSDSPAWAPPVASAEIFNPNTGLWSPTGAMAQPRWNSVNAVRLLTSTPAPISHTVSLFKSGTGTGTVISTAPDGTLSCGDTCSATYYHDTSVTLVATADPGNTFSGWSGCDSNPDAYTCVIAMNDNRSVTANFADTTPPSAPVVSGVTPTNDTTPTWSWSPAGGGNGTFQYRLKIGSTWLGVWSTETPATSFTPEAPLAEGAYTLCVKERDSAGNWSGLGYKVITIDLTPPETTLTGGPPNSTKSTSANFSFTKANGGISFECSLDGAAYETCTTPRSYTKLPETPHTFNVRALDAAGNADPTPATWTWTIDLTPPAAPLVGGTSTNNKNPHWSWTTGGSGGNGTFGYKLDNGTLTVTTDTTYAPASPLAVGIHSLYVQERDEAGNWSTFSKESLVIN